MEKNEFNVRAILAGQAPKDAPVTVKGWVRTRRDSKAGISFVHLSDGSCVPSGAGGRAEHAAPITPTRSCKLTAGCAVEATGTIVPSPAKGQPFEMQASAIKVIGWVDDPDTYPIQPKPHTHGVPARGGAPAAAHQRDRRGDARAAHAGAGDPPLLRRERLLLGQHADHHRRPTPRARASCSACRRSISPTCRARRRARSISRKDFFGREAFLTVSGQLNVEAYCLALTKVYTFGPTFRAENSNTSRHLAEFWMIEPEIAFADLSDDATLAEAAAEVHLRDAAEGAAGRPGLLRRAHREGAGGEACRASSTPSSCAWITPRRSRCWNGRSEKFEFPVQVGHRPAVGARALSHREARQEAGDRDELPEGHQGVLHARQRRRQNRRGDGRAGARHRRDHRRQPARGAARRARRAHGRARRSTRSTTAGTATCAATAPCRTPASASASSARSPTSPASPMCAT